MVMCLPVIMAVIRRIVMSVVIEVQSDRRCVQHIVPFCLWLMRTGMRTVRIMRVGVQDGWRMQIAGHKRQYNHKSEKHTAHSMLVAGLHYSDNGRSAERG